MKRNYSYLLLTILPIIAIFLPFTFENSYQATGVIYAQRELAVTNLNGAYTVDYRDRLSPGNDYSYVQQPERGDIQSLVKYGWRDGDRIAKGDTVIRFLSSYKFERKSQLLGDLGVEKANLAVMMTGAKPETRERAKKERDWAVKQFEIAQQNYDRVAPLVAQGYISEIELAEYTKALNTAAGFLDIANRKIKEVITGEKQEIVDLCLSNIRKIELELIALENTIGRLSVISPIEGCYKLSQFEGYVAGVEDRDTLIYMFPVTQDKLSLVSLGQEIVVQPYGHEGELRAEIVKIGTHAKIVESFPSLMVSAILIDKVNLPSGSLAKATVDLGDLSFWDYVTMNSRR